MTREQIDKYIIAHFVTSTAKEISEVTGMSRAQIYRIAKKFGVEHAEEFKNRKSLVGKKLGHLKVLERIETIPGQGSMYRCMCDCGKECIVKYMALKSGNTKSCGCHKYRVTHGDYKSKLYYVYRAMKDRCNNPNSANFKNYGDRGISICDEWDNSYVSFKEWAINNGYEEDKGLTIDRVDNNGDYCPENCRWISHKKQCNNTRRNRNITYQGKTQTIAQWADELGEPYDVLRWKVNKGTFPPNPNYIPKRGRLYEFRGKKLTIKQWAEEFGLNYHTVKHWVHDGKFPPKEGEPFNY